MAVRVFQGASQGIKRGVIVENTTGTFQKRGIDDLLADIAKWRYLKIQELRDYELLEFIDNKLRGDKDESI